MAITLERRSKGTYPFRFFHISLRSTYHQNMRPKARKQVGMFPRQKQLSVNIPLPICYLVIASLAWAIQYIHTTRESYVAIWQLPAARGQQRRYYPSFSCPKVQYLTVSFTNCELIRNRTFPFSLHLAS
jgi:hypothetical protein